MGLSGFGGARGNGQSWYLSARQHFLGLDAPHAMRLEHPRHVLLTPQRGVGRGRGSIDQLPQPGRIGGRAQREHLGIEPVQLVLEPIGTATKVFEPCCFCLTALSSP